MKTLVKRTWMKKSACFGIIAVMMITLLSSIRVEAKNTNTGSSDLNVDYHTKAEIAQYLNSCSFDYAYKNNYDSVPSTSAPYSLGKVSDRTLVDSITVLNAIRYIAGIPYNVTLDPYYIELTQAASVVMAANDNLSHNPSRPSGMSDELYEKGKTGAGSSNIAAGWGYGNLDNWFNLGFFIESCWMSDDDNGNIPMVGHRRWLLNPTMGKTGFGLAKTPDSRGIYSAVYAFDRSNTAGSSYNGVAWPAQNTPVKYFVKTDPWSLSTGEYVSSAAVVVTCENTGAKWEFSGDANCSKNTDAGYFNINNGGYGQTGCIIFRPNNITIDKDYSYNVSVTTDSGRSYKYTVDFFDPADYLNSNPEPTPTPDPSADQGDVEGFVSRFYTIILDREAEPEGLQNWVTALKAGTRGGADVADEFIHSPEFQAKKLSDDAYITKLYRAFFNREPDAAGKASWLQSIAEGKDRDFVLEGFLASDEYRDLCNSYGIKRESTRTFVKRFYSVAFGRTGNDISPSELDNWQIPLDARALTGADIAVQFFNSPEYLLHNDSNEVYLGKLYRVLFNRDMDAGGRQIWTQAFAEGYTKNEVLEEFLKSGEFKDMCNMYGINPGR